MDQFQRIDTLLKLDIFLGELCLVLYLAKLLLEHLLRAGSEGREVDTISKRNGEYQNMSAGLILSQWQ